MILGRHGPSLGVPIIRTKVFWDYIKSTCSGKVSFPRLCCNKFQEFEETRSARACKQAAVQQANFTFFLLAQGTSLAPGWPCGHGVSFKCW